MSKRRVTRPPAVRPEDAIMEGKATAYAYPGTNKLAFMFLEELRTKRRKPAKPRGKITFSISEPGNRLRVGSRTVIVKGKVQRWILAMLPSAYDARLATGDPTSLSLDGLPVAEKKGKPSRRTATARTAARLRQHASRLRKLLGSVTPPEQQPLVAHAITVQGAELQIEAYLRFRSEESRQTHLGLSEDYSADDHRDLRSNRAKRKSRHSEYSNDD